MKKNYLLILTVFSILTIALSSCTKEQQFLQLLNGTWKLDNEKDSKGVVVVHTPFSGGTYTLYELLVTFYDCNAKENEGCTGTSKLTTKYISTSGSTSTEVTNINSNTFTYRVFEKSQLIWGSTVYDIDDVSKKSLTIHPVESPLATREYSKQD